MRTYRHHRAEAIPRQVCITRAVLEKLGFTDGCLGCTHSAKGSTGIAHSDDCKRRVERKMKQDDVDKARLQESKRKRQSFVSRHLLSDKVKHARIGLDDEGKTHWETPDEQPGPCTSSSSSGETQHDNSMSQDSRTDHKRKRERDDTDEEMMADERLVMEVMCEDPTPQVEWEWKGDVKDYQEAELEE